MMYQNTRRGYTQEDKNAVNQNKCHSQMFLSGIYHACRYQIKRHSRVFLSGIPTTFSNQKGGDPRLRLSGMTLNLIPPHPACGYPLPQGARGTTRGFTLIELLVVVLIIGILAAVALPQYQKTIRKAQGREALVAADALNKALTDYYLEHGTYEGISKENLSVSIPQLKYARYCNSGWHDDVSRDWHPEWDVIYTKNKGDNADVYHTCIVVGNTYKVLLSMEWRNGRLTETRCNIKEGQPVDKPVVTCADYFDCDVSPFIQTSSAGKLFYSGGGCYL